MRRIYHSSVSLINSRWYFSAPLGYVPTHLLIWLYCEYCLCLWDHVDTPHRVFCRPSCSLFIFMNLHRPFSRCQMNHEYMTQNTLSNIKQMAQRLFTATYYVWIAYMLPMVRPYMIAQTLLVVIPSALWISSIHVDYPNRLGLIWIAICLGKTSQTWSLVWLVLVPYKEQICLVLW